MQKTRRRYTANRSQFQIPREEGDHWIPRDVDEETEQ